VNVTTKPSPIVEEIFDRLAIPMELPQ